MGDPQSFQFCQFGDGLKLFAARAVQRQFFEIWKREDIPPLLVIGANRRDRDLFAAGGDTFDSIRYAYRSRLGTTVQ